MILAFAFEELPLVSTPDGYETGFVTGTADIDYANSDVWKVAAIEVEVDKLSLMESGGRRTLSKRITPDTWVRQKIEFALLTEPKWKRHIQEAIAADIRQRAAEALDARGGRRLAGMLEV